MASWGVGPRRSLLLYSISATINQISQLCTPFNPGTESHRGETGVSQIKVRVSVVGDARPIHKSGKKYEKEKRSKVMNT